MGGCRSDDGVAVVVASADDDELETGLKEVSHEVKVR